MRRLLRPSLRCVALLVAACGLAVPALAEDEKLSVEELEKKLGEAWDGMAESVQEFEKEQEGNERYQAEKRGDALLAEGRFAEAIEAFDAAIALDPSAETPYVKKGIALYKSGNPKEAIPLFDHGMQITRRGELWNWWPLYHKGMAQGLARDFQGALASLDRSIALNATAENLFGRSMVYGELHDLPRALADVRRAQELAPRNEQLRYIRGMLERELAGAEFAQQAAARDGAQRLPSGLVYRELEPGTGARPETGSTVQVRYEGRHIDGSVFDGSGEGSARFPLGGVIPCFTEGIGRMRVGGRSQLVCPAAIAYGARGAGELIPPGSTLVFDVELLGIE